MGNVFSAMNISATGMTAQRTRLDVISQNIANVNSTRDADGNVYRRKSVIFEEKSYPTFSDTLAGATGMMGKGVKISEIFEDTEEPHLRWCMIRRIRMPMKTDMFIIRT